MFYVSTFVVPQIFRTTDYGGHWLPVTPGYDDPAAGLPKDRAFRHAATDADLTTSGYPGEVAAVVSDKVYFSADFGMTWHTVGGDAVTNDGPGGPCCRAPALFWGHAGATSVLLARNGADTYVADMALSSSDFRYCLSTLSVVALSCFSNAYACRIESTIFCATSLLSARKAR